MSGTLRVAGACLNQLPLAWSDNCQRILAAIAAAKAEKVALLCLPELCISGYGCEDMFLSPHVLDAAEVSLRKIVAASKGIAVLVGMPVRFQSLVYNAAVMICDGAILGVNAKRLLPREGVHYEARWFQPWPADVVGELTLCGKRVPIGDLAYDFFGVRVAVEICEEAWHATPSASEQVRAGAQIVLNPSASHFAFDKHNVRERLVANSSRSLQVHYVYANLVGLEAGRLLYDGGVLVASCGEVVARGPRFSFRDFVVTACDIDLDRSEAGRLKNRPVRQVTTTSVRSTAVIAAPRLQRSTGKTRASKAEARSSSADGFTNYAGDKNLDFVRAEVLALFDYLRRAKARGHVVSLSGGCDSATVAVLVAHMWAVALQEFGSSKALAARVGLPAPKQDAGNPRAWVQAYLTCVYQKTKNSSLTTEKVAAGIAKEIGATFYRVDVQPMVDAYLNAFAQSTSIKLDWAKDDKTLQNIQARARAPMAWLLANQRGALLLATCNRSEAAMGYATMDGDTAGGLSPIAGVDKHFLRAWARWAETRCPIGLGPVRALGAMNALAPTAELRPPEQEQSDEADLMPYAILERIERLLIRDKLAPSVALEHLVAEFSDIKPKQLHDYIKKFTTYWQASQWKRERYAPAFHLDDISLDPKTWCRYPLLSGGWEG